MMEFTAPFSGGHPAEGVFDHLSCVCRLFRWSVEMLDRFYDRRTEWSPLFCEGLRFLLALEAEMEARDGAPPLARIRARFGLSAFEEICLWLALAVELDEATGGIIRKCTGSGLAYYGLALSVYSLAYPVDESVLGSLPPAGPLCWLTLPQSEGELSARYRLRPEVLRYAAGRAPLPDPHIRWEEDSDALPELYPAQRAQLTRMIETAPPHGTPVLIFLPGRPGTGRRTVLRQACRAAGKQSMVVTPPRETEDWAELAQRAVCLSLLYGGILTVDASRAAEGIRAFVERLSPQPALLFLLAEREEVRGLRGLAEIPLPPLRLTDRAMLWEHWKGALVLDTAGLSERYRLSPGRIEAVLQAAHRKKAAGVPAADDMELVRREISLQNTGMRCFRLLPPAFGMDDLICEEKTKDLLRQVCAAARRRVRLYEQPHYARLFPYGRGLGVLLHGAPGTGKTMAVQVIARKLELDVMAVDLSALMDKYIGETEKHLTEIFDKAEENNCVLFFDEADALFAKRTEVGDAQDRHANTQTAHLLQKIEQFDGVSVLATNLLQNVDEAFLRRLPFVIGFGRPAPALRNALWRQFIPPEAPQEELDFDYLANTFDLAPAAMKWAALSAAVRAEGEPIAMCHVLDALRYEFDKMGLAFPDREYDDVVL